MSDFSSPSPAPRLRPTEAPRVVGETDELRAVHKPAHLLVHPTKPTGEPTLLDWLREQFPDEANALINRLDRETSGIVLVARHSEATSRLGKLMLARGMAKRYLAITWGEMTEPAGEIDAPIGRIGINESNPIYLKRGIMPEAEGGAASRTRYRLIHATSGYSLVECEALTGRLHQLRVHLAHIGFPVVGDKIYGPDPQLYLDFIENGWTTDHQRQLLLPRHALHAWRLDLPAADGTALAFESIPPSDLAGFWKEQTGRDLAAELAPAAHRGES